MYLFIYLKKWFKFRNDFPLNIFDSKNTQALRISLHFSTSSFDNLHSTIRLERENFATKLGAVAQNCDCDHHSGILLFFVDDQWKERFG